MKLLAEYEQRKDEFLDFAEFLKKKAQESPWQREMLKKFGKDKHKESA